MTLPVTTEPAKPVSAPRVSSRRAAKSSLPARSAVCYSTGQLHRVRPVESGERLAVVGWVQSLVRDPGMRELLHDLSTARELLVGKEGVERSLELVNKCYSNLLRRNAEP